MNGGEWVLPGAAALLIGISKTSVGGLAAIAVAVEDFQKIRKKFNPLAFADE